MRRGLLVVLVALALPGSALAWGGTYPTGDALGTSVHIDVADDYPVDQTLPQTWASFLGTLVHGRELATLTLRLAPMSEVSRVCGSQALACYDPSTSRIEVSPEDQLGEPPAREVVMHEYGHHVASNRSDAPWRAEDYGTKRWATYMHVCQRSNAGAASPGDEGSAYRENPGEAFAEAYRVLNLTRTGAAPGGWDIVDRAFYPDATALSLLEQDVLSPWTGPTTHRYRGTTRTIRLATPLDGTFTAKAAARSLSLTLVVNGKTVARGSTIRYELCGVRTVTLNLARRAGARASTVTVTKP